MNEMGLIEQVSRIINANYSNIYAIDIPGDKVYKFEFTVSNSLVIKEIIAELGDFFYFYISTMYNKDTNRKIIMIKNSIENEFYFFYKYNFRNKGFYI